MSFIVSVDGPAGSGKSSVSKMVAQKSKLLFISSGILYRICAHLMQKNNFLKTDEFIDYMKQQKIEYKNDMFYVNSKNLEQYLYSNEISINASNLAKDPLVREYVNSILKTSLKDKDIIMDGRDIGTVVFPNANLKIYLHASVWNRTKRRIKDNQNKKVKNESFIRTYFSIFKRDWQDKHRKIAPLIKPKNCIFINSDKLTIDDVVNRIINLINKSR